MDGGAWRVAVHGGHQDSDTTEHTRTPAPGQGWASGLQNLPVSLTVLSSRSLGTQKS